MKKKIAVITSGWSVDYVLSTLQGMEKMCRKRNADLYVFTSYKSFESNGIPNTTGFSIYDLIDPVEYDGIVFMPNLLNDNARVEKERKRILKSGVPAVSINTPLEGFHYVGSSNHDVCKNLVSHLIEQHGIKEFAYIGGPGDNIGSKSHFNAFKEALAEHGIPVPEDRLFLNGDWSYEFAYNKAQELFSRKKKNPEAVVCINDWAAMAVAKAALEHHMDVPGDLKVVGFDDISFASLSIPSISTVNIRADKIGEEAVKILLEGSGTLQSKKIKAVPYYRQSCGCVKEDSQAQKIHSMYSPQKIDLMQRFASHLRHIEDVFIRNGDIGELEPALNEYFEKRHLFEGNDFAILIKDEVIKSLANVNYSYLTSTRYGSRMRVLVNIKNGKAESKELSSQVIPTKDLIPPSMNDEKPGTFLFIPIFNQNYLQGYYVSKNHHGLLNDKIAYNWSRDFGASIEKFKQTISYKLMSERLTVLSTQDALSGLLNRTGLELFAGKLLEKNISANKKTFIMFVDINDMKVINDRHGHLHGDLAVKTVSEVLNEVFPKSFLKIRWGGDEFIVIGPLPAAGRPGYQEKITEKLALRTKSMSLPYPLSVSMGEKSFMPKENENLMKLIEEVDSIMYKKKQEYHKNQRTPQ